MNIVLPRVCQNPSRVFQANPSRQKHVDKFIPHLEELTQSSEGSVKQMFTQAESNWLSATEMYFCGCKS